MSVHDDTKEGTKDNITDVVREYLWLRQTHTALNAEEDDVSQVKPRAKGYYQKSFQFYAHCHDHSLI